MRYSSAIVALASIAFVRAGDYGPGPVSVSTDFITTEVTISKCGPGVTSCPYTTPTSTAGPKTPSVSVETDYITLSTTYCPLNATKSTSSTPKPTPTPTLSIYTSVVTHVTTKCPLSTGGPAPKNVTTTAYASPSPTSSAGALINSNNAAGMAANAGLLGAAFVGAAALFL